METKVCNKCGQTKSIEDFRIAYAIKCGRSGQCRDCYNKYANEYYHNNQEYRERLSQRAKDVRRDLRMEVMSHYSKGEPTCACCGETRYAFLSMDHEHGNGPEHRKEGIQSKTFYRWLRKNNYPSGYRVLCMNCNFAIGVHGQCPHQKERAAQMSDPSKNVINPTPTTLMGPQGE